MSYYLGVDVGTTYTAAAIWREGRVEVASLGNRAPVVPSVVLRPDGDGSGGEMIVGEAAARRAVTEPDLVAREFKRRFGDPTPIIVGGSPYSAEALTARVLRWVVDKVSQSEGGAPLGVAVSHPANWGDYKLDLLRQAIQLADLGDAATVSEPEAAAIHYATQERVPVGSVVALYDLGGGTFDAAVLRKTGAGWDILGEPQGIERLGGVDFDEAVFRHVTTALGDAMDGLDPEDPAAVAAVARLRQECVEAKEALSADAHTSIPVILPGVNTEVRLTRAELESMVRPALADSIGAMQRALRSAGVEADEVSAVLLVGGSSRLPIVAQLVGSEMGRPVAVDAHPKHGIALGAAIVAAQRDVADAAATSEVAAIAETPSPATGAGAAGAAIAGAAGAAAGAAAAGLLGPTSDAASSGPGETAASTAAPHAASPSSGTTPWDRVRATSPTDASPGAATPPGRTGDAPNARPPDATTPTSTGARGGTSQPPTAPLAPASSLEAPTEPMAATAPLTPTERITVPQGATAPPTEVQPPGRFEPPDDGRPRSRRGLWLAVGAVVVAAAAIGGAAAALSGGDDGGPITDTTTPPATETTAPPTETTAPPATETTAPPTETTAPPATETTTTTTEAPSGPQIDSFSGPGSVECPDAGSVEVTLSWSVTGAEQVTIGVDNPGPFDTFPPSGSAQLPFACPGPHTYHLVATGNGQEATDVIEIVSNG